MKTFSIINLRLTAINNELAVFNCEDTITGVIHTVPSKITILIRMHSIQVSHRHAPTN